MGATLIFECWPYHLWNWKELLLLSWSKWWNNTVYLPCSANLKKSLWTWYSGTSGGWGPRITWAQEFESSLGSIGKKSHCRSCVLLYLACPCLSIQSFVWQIFISNCFVPGTVLGARVPPQFGGGVIWQSHGGMITGLEVRKHIWSPCSLTK
jgi:hypothetical protein